MATDITVYVSDERIRLIVREEIEAAQVALLDAITAALKPHVSEADTTIILDCDVRAADGPLWIGPKP